MSGKGKVRGSLPPPPPLRTPLKTFKKEVSEKSPSVQTRSASRALTGTATPSRPLHPPSTPSRPIHAAAPEVVSVEETGSMSLNSVRVKREAIDAVTVNKEPITIAVKKEAISSFSALKKEGEGSGSGVTTSVVEPLGGDPVALSVKQELLATQTPLKEAAAARLLPTPNKPIGEKASNAPSSEPELSKPSPMPSQPPKYDPKTSPKTDPKPGPTAHLSASGVSETKTVSLPSAASSTAASTAASTAPLTTPKTTDTDNGSAVPKPSEVPKKPEKENDMSIKPSPPPPQSPSVPSPTPPPAPSSPKKSASLSTTQTQSTPSTTPSATPGTEALRAESAKAAVTGTASDATRNAPKASEERIKSPRLPPSAPAETEKKPEPVASPKKPEPTTPADAPPKTPAPSDLGSAMTSELESELSPPSDQSKATENVSKKLALSEKETLSMSPTSSKKPSDSENQSCTSPSSKASSLPAASTPTSTGTPLPSSTVILPRKPKGLPVLGRTSSLERPAVNQTKEATNTADILSGKSIAKDKAATNDEAITSDKTTTADKTGDKAEEEEAPKEADDCLILPDSAPAKKALTPVEELEARLAEVESLSRPPFCGLCSEEAPKALVHLLVHLHRKSHQCPKCPNRLANKNLLKHLKTAHGRFQDELTKDFLKKNIAELLELAETCFGLLVPSEDAEVNGTLVAAAERAEKEMADRDGATFNCSFKGVCGRVFDFIPSPQALNAHIIMHFTKQPFFKCEKCKHRLRSSLHSHDGAREGLADIRHSFKASYLDVLKQSFLPPPKAKVSAALTGSTEPEASESPNTPNASTPTLQSQSSAEQGETPRRSVDRKRRAESPPVQLLGDSPPRPVPRRRGRPSTRLNQTIASTDADDGIEVVSVAKRGHNTSVRSPGPNATRRQDGNTSLRRTPSAPPTPKLPPLFQQLRNLVNQLIAHTKAGPRSTIIQCQTCKQVLFVSDGVERLEGHVLGHMSGSVSVCDHCGKRFQSNDTAAHSTAAHQGKARFMPINSPQDLSKRFAACFPDLSESKEKGETEMETTSPAPVNTRSTPNTRAPPNSRTPHNKTPANSREDPQARGKAVQRELETRFEARAKELLEAETTFVKCPLKECGATVKVSAATLSGHVTFHSNKPLFVCLYTECRKKVKDIELHVRLTHPAFTTYEDLRPQFMPYLLRLLDLCFPPIPEAARKPKTLPPLKPTELITPDSLLKAAAGPVSHSRARPIQNNPTGKKSEIRSSEEVLGDMRGQKMFFAASESRWAAYTVAGKLIQCHKCDGAASLSAFIEDTPGLRRHIVQHMDKTGLECHLCKARVAALPRHIAAVHPKTAPGPDGLAKLDPLLLACLNSCLPPLPDEPDLEPAKKVVRRDAGVGTSMASTRTMPTQTPPSAPSTRSVGLSVVPARATAETQTIDAWTGRKGQEPVSAPQTRAEVLLYKIEVLDLILQRVKESRGHSEGKLFCRAQGCNFSFVYTPEASPIHQAVAYVEAHILEKHLSQYLFECLICEKKIPNLTFHWSQYHDDMSLMPWYYTDNRRPHLKKLKTAVGVCFPAETMAEGFSRSRPNNPSTPLRSQPPQTLRPPVSAPTTQNNRLPPGTPAPFRPPQTTPADAVDEKPVASKRGMEVEVLEPEAPPPPKRGRPPLPSPSPLPRRRGRPTKPVLTSSSTGADHLQATPPSAPKSDLDQRALRIYTTTLRGLEAHVKTPGRVQILCGLCKTSMGTAEAGGPRPLSRAAIEAHIMEHAGEELLWRCLLCPAAVNGLEAHFRNKHPRIQPAKDTNFADIRPETSQRLLAQMRKCFPRVKIEPLDEKDAAAAKARDAAKRGAPTTNPPPPTPAALPVKAQVSESSGPSPAGSFKIPTPPTTSSAVSATTTTPAPTTPARSVAAILQSRRLAEKAAAGSAESAARAEADARSSTVSVLLPPLDPDTLARHLSTPSPSNPPAAPAHFGNSTPARRTPPAFTLTPRRTPSTPARGENADCAIVGGRDGDPNACGPTLNSKPEPMEGGSEECGGMGQNGTAQNGMGQNGMGQNGMGQNGMGQNGMGAGQMMPDPSQMMFPPFQGPPFGDPFAPFLPAFGDPAAAAMMMGMPPHIMPMHPPQ